MVPLSPPRLWRRRAPVVTFLLFFFLGGTFALPKTVPLKSLAMEAVRSFLLSEDFSQLEEVGPLGVEIYCEYDIVFEEEEIKIIYPPLLAKLPDDVVGQMSSPWPQPNGLKLMATVIDKK